MQRKVCELNYYNKVEISGIDTSKLKTLSSEQKDRLLREAKSGNLLAREELINGNLRLVLSMIQRFSGRKESMDDLFQVGCMGLIKAIDNFDINVGVCFSTYAVPMIMGEIRRYLRDNNMIRVSRSTRDLANKALILKEEMIKSGKDEPSLEESAKLLGVSKDALSASMYATAKPLSLYEPVFSESGDSLFVIDQIKDDGEYDDVWIEKLSLKKMLSSLAGREKEIIQKRYFDGMTQMEVANEIGISQAQVSRLEKAAIDKIKKGF